MNNVELGRVARAIRRRLRMRQLDVARKARLHRSRVSKLERGQAADLHYGELQRIFEGLGAKLDARPLWRGPQLDRLLDEEHAQLQARWKARLEAWRWLVPAEVSFSQYGERGRIDLLAWHPDSRVLVVIEIKTDFVEAHDLLGTLDVKARLAPGIARELGWEAPAAVVRMVLFKDSSTVRQRVERFGPLFSDFTLRGRAAISWLRSPSLEMVPRGMLVFSDLPNVAQQRAKQVAPERVRVLHPQRSLDEANSAAVSARGVG